MSQIAQDTNDHGISLMEVVVSMVILSMMLSMMANIVVHNIQNVVRSDAGVTSSTIAQDSMERLLSVPVSKWAFDANGNIKNAKSTSMYWGDGRTYRIERRIEPVTSPYQAVDTCDAVVGAGTSASDLIKVSIAVSPLNNKGRDRYETAFYLSRDEHSVVTESSLTVRFNVVQGDQRTRYNETMDGGIRVVIGKGTSKERAATTKKGCVTFIGLQERQIGLAFTTQSFKESLSGHADYKELVYLVKGGHRLIEYDLLPQRQLTVVPRIMGNRAPQCDQPRLLRTRMVLKAPENRAFLNIRELADAANTEYERLMQISEHRRSRKETMRIQSGSRWQYYLECIPERQAGRHNQQTHLHLLPDTIPISLVTTKGRRTSIKPVATWADSTFRPSEYPHVEEADWPIVSIPDLHPGETQRLMVGSCVMAGSETQGVLVDANGPTTPYWKRNKPDAVYLPMWPAYIDGVQAPARSLPVIDHTYSVVIKQVYDDDQDAYRFGDDSIRQTNMAHYAGCKDTPVFHVGWLNAFDNEDDYAQLRMLLPYGLYTYSFNTPDQTETNEQGQTVIKSRHSCDEHCNWAAGESQCIRAGAQRYFLFEGDGRTLLRDYYGSYVDYSGYVAWEDRTITRHTNGWTRHPIAPRGPVLEGCPAYQ